MLGFKINFDNRDNLLSPSKGIYAGGNFYYNSTIFGGDENFGLLSLFSKFYIPVSGRVHGAFRFDGRLAEKGIPFYAKPFIQLRGVPAARYQGNQVMVVETQWRWTFFKSLSVLGFTGTGKAMDSFEDFGSSDWIYNYGVGARVALNKLFDLRVGADAAWSNEDFAWYFSVGSSF
jgi:outer membrane protein assembly factor BamA